MSEVKNVTITVPVGLNGWQQTGSVVINGMKVEFPMGVETQVPETAAALLEKLIEEAKGNAAEGSVGKYKQYVTDENGNVAWEDRLAYKTTEKVVNLDSTVLEGEDENGDGSIDGFFLLSPWTADLLAGSVVTVTCNGTAYACQAIDYSQIEPDEPAGIVIMGNVAAMGVEGIEGSNPDAPFFMLAMSNAVAESAWGGTYGILKPTDGATAVTIAVSSAIETVKTIDPKYLPKQDVLLVTVDPTTLTFDHPYDDVYAALLAGKPVQIRAGADGRYNVLTPISYSADFIGLLSVAYADTGFESTYKTLYKINSDGTIEVVG